MSQPLVQIGNGSPGRAASAAPGTRLTPRVRLPEWARKPRTHFESLNRLKSGLRRLDLHTVCESARCPNIHECFHRGAATFMILGERCTRGCGFCAVPKGKVLALDPAEPAHVAQMARAMGLRYVVITSVNRDDLADGGSAHFAETVGEVRRALPEARVEVLTPDFRGDLAAVARVLAAGPHVFNHNMETVPRLYRRVRPQADYRQSLRVLEFAAQKWGQGFGPAAGLLAGAELYVNVRAGQKPGGSPKGLAPRPLLVKSGFMVGLGETEDEVRGLLRDLRDTGADVATIGQYLQPTRRNLPVSAYIEPQQFEAYREYGLSLGFKMVFSGPLVRSSYMADAVNDQARQPLC